MATTLRRIRVMVTIIWSVWMIALALIARPFVSMWREMRAFWRELDRPGAVQDWVDVTREVRKELLRNPAKKAKYDLPGDESAGGDDAEK